MFINNINPVLLSIGPFEIRYYGIVYALGFLVTYLLLRWAAKNKAIDNLDEQKVDSLVIYLMISMIVGARLLFFIITSPGTLIVNPLEFFRTWHGGMSFHGGLLGLALVGWLFCKKHKIRFYQLADFVVIPAALFLFFGRIANFINGELAGTKTNVPWCVVFKGYDGCRHPSQLYEALKNLFMFFVLSFMYTHKSLKAKLKEGVMFWSFVLMYGTLRFIISFWREDQLIWPGISIWQYLCLSMVVVSCMFIWKITKNNNKQKK